MLNCFVGRPAEYWALDVSASQHAVRGGAEAGLVGMLHIAADDARGHSHTVPLCDHATRSLLVPAPAPTPVLALLHSIPNLDVVMTP